MRLILGCFLAILSLGAAAQDNQLCRNIAAETARESIARSAETLSVTIPSITSDSVVNDISQQVCDTVDQARSDKIKEITSSVASAYFENAVKLGKSTEVAALVDAAIDHTLGLGLDDLRRYGTLTVSCAYSAATVELRGSAVACGRRTLLDRGDLQIRVTGAAVELCRASATLRERQELTCNCLARVDTRGIPLTMECN
jgi:hypothetical protein